MLESPFTEFTITVFILTNAITIGMQANHRVTQLLPLFMTSLSREQMSAEGKAPGYEIPLEIEIFEYIFFAMFSLELMARFFAYGVAAFTREDKWWTGFDTVLVIMALLDLIGNSISDHVNTDALQFTRVLRLFRIVRILRVIRLLRFVQELHSMVFSIVASLKALLWAIVLLFLLVYISSVTTLTLLGEQMVSDQLTILNLPMETTHELHDYYGTLMESMLSFFQAITSGKDWRMLMDPLRATIDHAWVPALFSSYIAFCVFAMLNVITGVFTDKAIYSEKVQRETELESMVFSLFERMGLEDDDVIRQDDFEQALDMPELRKYLDHMGIELAEARALFVLLDDKSAGEVDLSGFVNGCARLDGAATSIDLSTMMHHNKHMAVWTENRLGRIESMIDGLSSMLLSLPDVDKELAGYSDGFKEMIHLPAWATWAELRKVVTTGSNPEKKPKRSVDYD